MLCRVTFGVPPVTCSAQGNAPLATVPLQVPLACVVTALVKPLPSAHLAVKVPPTIGLPTAAVPVSVCALAGVVSFLVPALSLDEPPQPPNSKPTVIRPAPNTYLADSFVLMFMM